MVSKIRKVWDWFSWGKDLAVNPAYSQNPLTGSASPAELQIVSESERKHRLDQEVAEFVGRGYSIDLAQEFLVILKKKKQVGVVPYFLINIPLLLLFGLFWFVFFLVWSAVLVARLVNRKFVICTLEVDGYGKIDRKWKNG